MANTIQFNDEELSELQSFYLQELEKTEQRLNAIKLIVSKIGTGSKKKGRKSSAEKSAIELVDASTSSSKGLKSPAKGKRGRPAKVKVAISAPKKTGRPAKNVLSSVTNDVTAKRRGRPAKVKAETTKTASPIATKRRGRPAKAAASAKPTLLAPSKRRGRPAKVEAKTPATPTTAKRRGRPAKVASKASATQAASLNNKRTSSPSKAIKTSVAKPSAGKRGRPAKVKDVKVEAVKSVGKRGRPAKAVVSTSTTAIAKVLAPASTKKVLTRKVTPTKVKATKAKKSVKVKTDDPTSGNTPG